MFYLVVALGLVNLFIAAFMVGTLKHKHDVIDIVWGMGFIGSAMLSLMLGAHGNSVSWVMTALVTVWGVRLSTHLIRRNSGKPEDFRYADMRKKFNPATFHIRMFITVYLLQFGLNYLIGLPIIVANLEGNAVWNLFSFAGILVWVVGFAFEAIGDRQLRDFRNNPANKGHLIEIGLWRYSRHPNYFGEAVQWWGIWLMAASNSQNLVLIVSPITITFLLLFVSGVPLLEQKYAGRPDWEVYKAKTSMFFPLPPKKEPPKH